MMMLVLGGVVVPIESAAAADCPIAAADGPGDEIQADEEPAIGSLAAAERVVQETQDEIDQADANEPEEAEENEPEEPEEPEPT